MDAWRQSLVWSMTELLCNYYWLQYVLSVGGNEAVWSTLSGAVHFIGICVSNFNKPLGRCRMKCATNQCYDPQSSFSDVKLQRTHFVDIEFDC